MLLKINDIKNTKSIFHSTSQHLNLFHLNMLTYESSQPFNNPPIVDRTAPSTHLHRTPFANGSIIKPILYSRPSQPSHSQPVGKSVSKSVRTSLSTHHIKFPTFTISFNSITIMLVLLIPLTHNWFYLNHSLDSTCSQLLQIISSVVQYSTVQYSLVWLCLCAIFIYIFRKK